jgi:hypothetical protein
MISGLVYYGAVVAAFELIASDSVSKTNNVRIEMRNLLHVLTY